jgi:hypothetical protein
MCYQTQLNIVAAKLSAIPADAPDTARIPLWAEFDALSAAMYWQDTTTPRTARPWVFTPRVLRTPTWAQWYGPVYSRSFLSR